MRLTIQTGIDAHDLQRVIHQTFIEGVKCLQRAEQKRHEEQMALIKKAGGPAPTAAKGGQGSLLGRGMTMTQKQFNVAYIALAVVVACTVIYLTKTGAIR